MIDKSKAKNVKTLGSSTEGEGSERYQLVKKMVEAGALSGSQNSLCKSGLLIGSETARKYHAALIRDGIIREKKDSQKNTCNNKKQTPEIIIGDEISETQKFDDFESFAMGMSKKKGFALANAALAFIKIFEKQIERIERCEVEYGRPRDGLYRTGYLVEKGVKK